MYILNIIIYFSTSANNLTSTYLHFILIMFNVKYCHYVFSHSKLVNVIQEHFKVTMIILQTIKANIEVLKTAKTVITCHLLPLVRWL